MPERIQQRRTKGWRMPTNTVSVARPSKWGNPFKIGETYSGIRFPYLESGFVDVDTAAEAVECFRAYMTAPCSPRIELDELRGKDLACWCPLDQPCHADVLLELANQGGGLLEVDPEPVEDAFGITHGVTVEQAVGLAASLVQTLGEAVPTIRRLENVIEQKAIEENR